LPSTGPSVVSFNEVPQFQGEQYIFLACTRKMLEVLDYAKVADVICPVLSVADIDLVRFKANPHEAAGAFDALGLDTISVLRAQGIGRTVPLIQDIPQLPPGKRKEARDLFHLFLKSEFEESSKIISLEEENDLMKLMLELKGATNVPMESRDERGYMLVEGIEFGADVLCLA